MLRVDPATLDGSHDLPERVARQRGRMAGVRRGGPRGTSPAHHAGERGVDRYQGQRNGAQESPRPWAGRSRVCKQRWLLRGVEACPR